MVMPTGRFMRRLTVELSGAHADFRAWHSIVHASAPAMLSGIPWLIIWCALVHGRRDDIFFPGYATSKVVAERFRSDNEAEVLRA